MAETRYGPDSRRVFQARAMMTPPISGRWKSASRRPKAKIATRHSIGPPRARNSTQSLRIAARRIPAAKLRIPMEAKITMALRPGSPGSDGIDCMTEEVT